MKSIIPTRDFPTADFSCEMRLSGLRYRGMELDLSVKRASSAAERTAATGFIPADRTGTVQVTFVL